MLVKDLQAGSRIEYRGAHPSDRSRKSGLYTCKLHNKLAIGNDFLLTTDTHPQGIIFAGDMEIAVLPEITDERQMNPSFARKVVRKGRSLD